MKIKAWKKNWAQIRSARNAQDTAELLIYGDIGESWWNESVTARDLVSQLQEIEASTIRVRINSFGGSVADGLAIYNALRSHPATIHVVIEGVAMSIASLIAMAGDHIEMPANARFMVHAPWGDPGPGNEVQIQDFIDVLRGFRASMVSSYVRVCGEAKRAEIDAMLADGKNHYYSAEDAEAFGFVHEVTREIPVAAHFSGLRRFKDLPAAAAAFATPKEHNMDWKALAAALKLTVTSDNEADIKAAVLARLNLQADATDAQINAAVVAAQKPASTPAAPAASGGNVVDIDAARNQGRDAAMAALAARNQNIRAAFSPFLAQDGIRDLYDSVMADPGISEDNARNQLLAKLGQGVEPVGARHSMQMGEDSREKFTRGATNVLLARAGLAQRERDNEFQSFTLFDLARASLDRNGISSGRMSRMELVATAFTHHSSDFTHLLENIAEKSMLKGAEEAEETFEMFTSKGVLSDFKVAKRVDLSKFPSLDEIPEGAEYKYATLGDSGEQVQLATFGKLFAISRQAIINDDMDGFTRVPRRMGRAAKRTVGNLVYAILIDNPKMSDNVALFHANHSNLIAPASVITSDSVDKMRVAMGTQTEKLKDGQGKLIEEVTLNIRLAKLIVPIALEGKAKQVRNSEFHVGESTTDNTIPNSVRDTFEVVSDARLDRASATAWYGAADPNVHDGIEVQYLDGVETPFLDRKEGWNVDGVELKVRLDAGVKALASNTLAKNAGA